MYNRARDLFPGGNWCQVMLLWNMYTIKEDSAMFSIIKGCKYSQSPI